MWYNEEYETNLIVVERFPVKGYPCNLSNFAPNVNKENTNLFAKCYARTSKKVCEITGSKENALSLHFVDKITPHALYDFMFIDGSKYYKYSIFEYSDCVQRKCQDLFNKVIEILLSPEVDNLCGQNKIINITYNYDPYTRDRASIMSEKRYHIHFCVYTEEDVKLAQTLACKYSDINRFMQYRLVDPFLDLTMNALYDALEFNGITQGLQKPSIKLDAINRTPLGVKYHIVDNKYPMQLIRKVHEVLIETYRQLHGAYFENQTINLWYRPLLNSQEIFEKRLESINCISENTKLIAYSTYRYLKNISDTTMNWLRTHRKFAIQNISLSGVAYSCTFSLNTFKNANSENNILSFYPKIISDLGGAGVTSFGNANLVRIKRNQGVMSSEEIKKRMDFQKIVYEKI